MFSLTDGPMAKAKIRGPGQGTAFAFDPEGAAVWFGNAAGELCRIELANKELTVLNVNNVYSYHGIRFSPDGKRIAFERCDTDENGSVIATRLYCADPDGKNEVQLLDGFTSGFSFLANGRLAVLTDRSVRSFDSKTGKGEKISGEWKNPLGTPQLAGFSSDGETFFFSKSESYFEQMMSCQTKTGTTTTLKKEPLATTFQPPIMVRVPKKP